jgi:creatinine amidohydrolase
MNATDEVMIERMTWPEIGDAIASGKRTAIIVAGSTEQHGPHLGEATDAILGEETARRLAHRLGDALVAPVIRPGCSDHHLAFPGTISISAQLLMDLLDAYVASLARHGFTTFIVLSSHGGNFPVLERWASERPHPGAHVLADLDRFVAAMLAPLERFGRSDTTISHADVCETSQLLAIRPDLVRMGRVETGYVGPVDVPRLLREGLKSITPNGILGDPVGSRPDIGEAVFESLVEYLQAEVVAERVL